MLSIIILWEKIIQFKYCNKYTEILVHYNRGKGNDLLYYSTIVRKMLFQIYKLFKPSAFIKLKTSGCCTRVVAFVVCVPN